MAFGPKVCPTWYKATERRADLLIISETAHWISHWDPEKGRSQRCGGLRCMACHLGSQKQLRVVVLVVDSAGKEFLLELRERHREALDRWDSVVGLRITIRKLGAAKNSPVEIKGGEREYAVPRDISRLVDVLGGRPVLLAEGDLDGRADPQPHPKEPSR